MRSMLSYDDVQPTVSSSGAVLPAAGCVSISGTRRQVQESIPQFPRNIRSPDATPVKPIIVQSPSDPLAVRGKGNYTCPYGRECKKGGVGVNGELVVFERNSAFKYVSKQLTGIRINQLC